ncbi:DUF3618 domain-containing protein [Knoellia subterranea]|uniref:DUF3618 domain-containing protein n=1 Tax=Knoellia subterranea KCTC 19937 TaxID=1385521 RepID=A0A0A0JP55_9MICO|nr:DUF3618 domain-containing protein [Knoellia subterranea]KGN39215.1 hypothetical protein N803_01585 [Knoellia subterranea KCTC 19937]
MSHITALEADIAQRRTRLANTLNELTAKATPSAIAKREVDKAKQRFADATTTPQGDLRVERVAAAVAVVAVIVAFKVLRGRRR